MPKLSFEGWKNPRRRARYILWLGAVVLIFVPVMITALAVTSSYWFCANACHKVQDDTIKAYNQSTHNKISCMACHMPVNANVVTFLLHKMEALGELYMTITDAYPEPLNENSEVALTMPATQCTQCHSPNRVVTPSPGIIINHKIHADKEVACPICHNRVAHPDDNFIHTSVNKKLKERGHAHANFMVMRGCFRCHSQTAGGLAKGNCPLCHTPSFKLVPASHVPTASWLAISGHPKAANDSLKEVANAKKEAAAEEASGKKTETPESATVAKMKPFNQVFECSICHAPKFCVACHGLQEIPHPTEFKQPKSLTDPQGHPVISKAAPKTCVHCHGVDTQTHFCSSCHHGTYIGSTYSTTTPWVAAHGSVVASVGVTKCTSTCHQASFCVACHTRNRVFPRSHRAFGWTFPPTPTVSTGGQPGTAKVTAKHPGAYNASPETCAVCHGPGGTTAKFCRGCHKLPMPHSDDFKTTPGVHRTVGLRNTRTCQICHRFNQICSNCHHIGASDRRPWIQIHGPSVVKNGAQECLQCHPNTNFCAACHTRLKVVPPSHKAVHWTHDYSNAIALHAQTFQKDGTICTYCHGKGGTSSAFCMRCHKLPMPHPDGFGPPQGAAPTKDNGGQHAQMFQQKKVTKAVCQNCHLQKFCDSCHHPQNASSKLPWQAQPRVPQQHPQVVKAGGATQCFSCHQETFCSACHVNIGR